MKTGDFSGLAYWFNEGLSMAEMLPPDDAESAHQDLLRTLRSRRDATLAKAAAATTDSDRLSHLARAIALADIADKTKATLDVAGVPHD